MAVGLVTEVLSAGGGLGSLTLNYVTGSQGVPLPGYTWNTAVWSLILFVFEVLKF